MLGALAVVAVLAALAAGIYWWVGARGPTASTAAQRDQALDAMEQIVVNITTVHPGTVDADMAKAQDSLAEPMLSAYGKVRQQFTNDLRQAQANVDVTPASGALTGFDAEKGTASGIVAINVTASSTQAPPNQKQQLFQVEMLRQPDGAWKASKAAPSNGQS